MQTKPNDQINRINQIDELEQLVGVESPPGDKEATKRSAEVVAEIGARHLGSTPERHGNHLVWRHGPTRILLLGGGDTTVTPTVLRAGTTTNTVPAGGTLSIDVRAFENAEFARVDRALKALRPRVEGTTMTVTGKVGRPPLPRSDTAFLFQTAGDVAVDLGLRRPDGVAVGGASDGNLTASLGVPTLDGLGAVGGNAHAEGEWVDLDAMAERSRFLAAPITRLRR
jgi:glutamate carboxypeptidase